MKNCIEHMNGDHISNHIEDDIYDYIVDILLFFRCIS